MNTTDTTRHHERQFPLKKLEGLIRLAIDNDLAVLEVGDIRIVPSGRQAIARPTIFQETEDKIGRALTDEEKRDEILFGPGGSLRIDE